MYRFNALFCIAGKEGLVSKHFVLRCPQEIDNLIVEAQLNDAPEWELNPQPTLFAHCTTIYDIII